MEGIETLLIVSIVMFAVLGAISVLAHIYNLNNIKAKTVGDGLITFPLNSTRMVM